MNDAQYPHSLASPVVECHPASRHWPGIGGGIPQAAGTREHPVSAAPTGDHHAPSPSHSERRHRPFLPARDKVKVATNVAPLSKVCCLTLCGACAAGTLAPPLGGIGHVLTLSLAGVFVRVIRHASLRCMMEAQPQVDGWTLALALMSSRWLCHFVALHRSRVASESERFWFNLK